MKNNQQNFKDGVINHLLTKIPTASTDDKVGDIVKLIRGLKSWDTI